MAKPSNPNSAAGQAYARNTAISNAGKAAGLTSNQIAQQQQNTKPSSSTPSTSSTTTKTTPTNTTKVDAPGSKVMSQASYNTLVSQMNAAGKPVSELDSLMKSKGYTVATGTTTTNTTPTTKTTTTTSGITTPRPSGVGGNTDLNKVNKINALANLEAGNITQKQYDDVLGTTSTTPEEEATNKPDKLGDTTNITDSPAADAVEPYQSELNTMKSDEIKTYLDKVTESNNNVIAALRLANTDAANKTSQSLTDRMNQVNTTYTNIDTKMKELAEKAKNVFDQGAMRQSMARAKQLEAMGLLSNEQVAQAAQADIADYRRTAEFEKADMEKTILEQQISAEKEKLAAIDLIQRDVATSAQQKQQNVQAVEQWYGNMVDSIQTKKAQTNNQYNQLINQYGNIAAQQDLSQQNLLTTDKTEYAVQQQQKQRADQDPAARRDYILNGIADANILKYVDNVIALMKKNGTFMTKDVDSLKTDILAAAAILQKKNEEAGKTTGMYNPAL